MIAKALIYAGFVAIGLAACGRWPLFVTAVALIAAGQLVRVRVQ